MSKTSENIEETKKVIENEVKQMIKDNPECFPFIAQFWNISIMEPNKPKTSLLEFGNYNSKSIDSYPFYKPFSKIVDLGKIKND